jgi:hypothetical protein
VATIQGRAYRRGMPRFVLPALVLLTAVLSAGALPFASLPVAALAQTHAQTQTAAPAAAQAALPHAWLYGAWTGGLFPAPVTLSAQECLANPTVIFTRDAVLRAVPTDVTYAQNVVETVRAVPGGLEFRLAAPQVAASPGAFGLALPPAQGSTGFGCDTPGVLRVQRRGEDQIAFAACPAFPYPLTRCPAR